MEGWANQLGICMGVNIVHIPCLSALSRGDTSTSAARRPSRYMSTRVRTDVAGPCWLQLVAVAARSARVVRGASLADTSPMFEIYLHLLETFLKQLRPLRVRSRADGRRSQDQEVETERRRSEWPDPKEVRNAANIAQLPLRRDHHSA